MARTRMPGLARGNLPQTDRAVPAARDQGLPVRRESQGGNDILVFCHRAELLPRGRLPPMNPASASGEQDRAVTREGQGTDTALQSSELAQLFPRGDIEETNQ